MSGFRDFLTWWRAELLALIPLRLRQLAGTQGHLVLLFDSPSRATLSVEDQGKETTLGQVEQPATPEGQTALRALLQQPAVIGLTARNKLARCLRLPSRYGLCRTIELPLAAERNLSEVVGFELDRYTPFRAEHAYYTCRLVARDPAAGQLSAEIVVVPRNVLDEALAVATSLGWPPEWVDLADPAPDIRHSDNLLAPQSGRARHQRERWTYRLAAATAILAVVAAAVPFVAMQHQAAVMEAELQAVHKQAQAAITLQEKLQSLRDDESFLVERKQRLLSISRLLAVATHVLPDDTWLVELRADGPDVEFTGTTASASTLIGILERSGMFRDTSFRSPVTPEPGSNKERFDIAAHIVPENH